MGLVPIYAFRCWRCNHEWERIRPLDSPVPPCEKCNAEGCVKIPTAPAIQFKDGGVGWARDGYSKDGK